MKQNLEQLQADYAVQEQKLSGFMKAAVISTVVAAISIFGNVVQGFALHGMGTLRDAYVEQVANTQQDMLKLYPLRVQNEKQIADNKVLIEGQATLISAQAESIKQLTKQNELLGEADQSMATLNKDECKRRFGIGKGVDQKLGFSGASTTFDAKSMAVKSAPTVNMPSSRDNLCILDRDGVMRDPQCLPLRSLHDIQGPVGSAFGR